MGLDHIFIGFIFRDSQSIMCRHILEFIQGIHGMPIISVIISSIPYWSLYRICIYIRVTLWFVTCFRRYKIVKVYIDNIEMHECTIF